MRPFSIIPEAEITIVGRGSSLSAMLFLARVREDEVGRKQGSFWIASKSRSASSSKHSGCRATTRVASVASGLSTAIRICGQVPER
jgi:fructoselysine-6-P-deglycase FrlB-like protein